MSQQSIAAPAGSRNERSQCGADRFTGNPSGEKALCHPWRHQRTGTLRVIARVMRPFTTGLFDRVGRLGVTYPGRCGGGDVTLLWRAKLAPRDLFSARHGRDQARARQRRGCTRRHCQCRVRHADITRLADESTYDVVYARFLLSNLPDPAGALVKLISMLRPGGLLIVEDVDHSGCVCAPEVGAYRHYQRLYRLLAKRRGVDADIGARLPHLRTEAVSAKSNSNTSSLQRSRARPSCGLPPERSSILPKRFRPKT